MDSKQKYSIANIDPLTLSIKAAQEKKIQDSRDFFEQLVADYRTCGRFWKIYIEQELRARNFEEVENLFQRCVIKVLNIDLWRTYLNYVRDIKSKLPNYKEKTAQAYNFALEKIGLDVNSYSIWNDYVNFLKSVEAAGSFAENQKIMAIRKVYQKGVMNPMINVDQFWKDYCAFENQINPLIAKRMIDDRSREFMTVRKISKEYENVTKYLDRNSPCFPPQGTVEELRQKTYWKKYIEWEKSNPLKTDDLAIVAKRVMYAYEQCLLSLATHPDIYFEATSYLQQMSSIMEEKCDAVLAKFYANEAVNLYERAIESFMKKNALIYFAYCDFEESRLNYSKCKEIYEKYIEICDVDPSLCYIQYMRFLRRVEGIRSTRQIFKKARDDPRISYHVYVAAAFMEYFCTKDKNIAYKIFQLGSSKYESVPEYLLAFVELAKHINEDDTTRSLLENSIAEGKIPKDKTNEIWTEWLQFENFVGKLEDIKKVEKSRQAMIGDINQPDESESKLLIDRYKFSNLYPCSKYELKSIGYTDSNYNFAFNLFPGFKQGESLSTSLALANSSVASLGATKDKSFVSTKEDVTTSQTLETSLSANPFNRTIVTRPRFPEPDMTKMYPFKQNRDNITALQPVPGGGLFLFPSIFGDLIKRLPPPSCFDGPFVAIDEFIAHLQALKLPDDFQSFYKSYSSSRDSSKRGDEESNTTEKTNNLIDIYKQRQQKKMVK
ncbi:unnamed protein product [Brachionus calyciflorus]|uniref:Suppressor of forked domain-containing protein n=1 Tax=Brachionus calyciflorus TaxID=104777 RepID=A0A813QKK7_9BILA|nr:unnamed protein product [Brachionus calyciflorus]